ncbi:MAG: cytochrome P450 [Alphaproteobacteria bacterium]
MADTTVGDVGNGLAGLAEAAAPASPPFERGHWLLGVLPQMRADPLAFFARLANRHGPAVGLSLAGHKALMLNDPAALRHVFQDNWQNYRKSKFYGPLKPMLGGGIFMVEGERWLRQRRVANPAFQGCKMPALLGAMVAATGEMLDRWSGRAGADPQTESAGSAAAGGWAGGPFPARAWAGDLAPEMTRVTLDIILRSLLGYRMDGEYAALYEALATLLADAEKRAWSFVSLPPWVPTPHNRACARAHAVIAELVEKVIAERRQSGVPQDDLLDAFIAAYSDPKAGGFQPSILVDEVRSFILAGHETTANAMCWVWLELSRNPAVREQVLAEIDRELGGSAPTLESVQRLKYCRAVLDETLRVHPTVWTLSRQANAAERIPLSDGRSLAVAKDQTVILCPYAVHHRTALWGDPERFRPERFLEPRHDQFAYFPFAKGPRHCLGSRFAIFEALIIMAMTLQRFDVTVDDPSSVQAAPMITLRPDGPVRAHVTPRQVRQAA